MNITCKDHLTRQMAKYVTRALPTGAFPMTRLGSANDGADPHLPLTVE